MGSDSSPPDHTLRPARETRMCVRGRTAVAQLSQRRQTSPNVPTALEHRNGAETTDDQPAARLSHPIRVVSNLSQDQRSQSGKTVSECAICMDARVATVFVPC